MRKIPALLFALPLAVALTGCMTTSERLNDIELGMTKSQALSEMGTPSYAAANQDVEFLVYRLIDPKWDRIDEYFVKLVDGRVCAYGRIGDLDSAHDRTIYETARRNAEMPEPAAR